MARLRDPTVGVAETSRQKIGLRPPLQWDCSTFPSFFLFAPYIFTTAPPLVNLQSSPAAAISPLETDDVVPECTKRDTLAEGRLRFSGLRREGNKRGVIELSRLCVRASALRKRGGLQQVRRTNEWTLLRTDGRGRRREFLILACVVGGPL